MGKKINSEIKFQNETFKVKIGTVDKKNPETIYIELGCYITPIKEYEFFKEKIEQVEKNIKNFYNGVLKINKNCSSDFILITEVAYDRMEVGKKSFFEMEIHLKPSIRLLENNDNNFKNIANIIFNEFVEAEVPFIKEYFKREGFECAKTKK